MDTMFFFTSEEGEEQKCIGCLFCTSKKYSGPIGYICPYTILLKVLLLFAPRLDGIRRVKSLLSIS